MDIPVIKRNPDTGVVSFSLGSQPLSGASKLVQIVVLSLLNGPGKDLLDPALGGGVLDMIGMNITPNDSDELTAEFVRRVKKVQTEILDSQVGVAIPDEEKLQQLTLVSSQITAEGDGIEVVIRILNAAGRETDVVL